ncbi:hypothetical protein [Sporosarcina sp. NPDC096371]
MLEVAVHSDILVSDNAISFTFSPFEVKTTRFTLSLIVACTGVDAGYAAN